MRTIVSTACLLALATLFVPAAQGGMTGSVTITELFPNSSTVFNGGTDALAVGSSLSCPGASALCTSGYFAQPATFSITANTIGLSEQCCTSYTADPFNGYSFTNVNFADGGFIGGVILASSNMAGILASDITFTGHSILINLQGVGVGAAANQSPGTFTLTVAEAPEPGSLAMLGASLVGLAFMLRRRA
jgi:hypothetical protein